MTAVELAGVGLSCLCLSGFLSLVAVVSAAVMSGRVDRAMEGMAEYWLDRER